MNNLKERVSKAINEVLNRYFECPERNWPGATHEAIGKVKAELVGRVEAEFDRGTEKAEAAPVAVDEEAK